MTADKHKPSDSRQIFDEYLQRTCRRRTQERFMILECAQSISGHFTADDIITRMNSKNKPVATGTVYTTLQLLADCGLVTRQHFDDGATRYECNEQSHLHLVCSQCGKIKDVRDDALETLIRSRRFTAFTPSYIALTVYGTCSACARANRAAAKKKNINNTISKSQKRK